MMASHRPEKPLAFQARQVPFSVPVLSRTVPAFDHLSAILGHPPNGGTSQAPAGFIGGRAPQFEI